MRPCQMIGPIVDHVAALVETFEAASAAVGRAAIEMRRGKEPLERANERP